MSAAIEAAVERGAERIEDLLAQLGVAFEDDAERMDIARTLSRAVVRATVEPQHEALREIVRAVDAWDKDEPFGIDTDEEQEFTADMDFVAYVGKVARAALSEERS